MPLQAARMSMDQLPATAVTHVWIGMDRWMKLKAGAMKTAHARTSTTMLLMERIGGYVRQ